MDIKTIQNRITKLPFLRDIIGKVQIRKYSIALDNISSDVKSCIASGMVTLGANYTLTTAWADAGLSFNYTPDVDCVMDLDVVVDFWLLNANGAYVRIDVNGVARTPQLVLAESATTSLRVVESQFDRISLSAGVAYTIKLQAYHATVASGVLVLGNTSMRYRVFTV